MLIPIRYTTLSRSLTNSSKETKTQANEMRLRWASATPPGNITSLPKKIVRLRITPTMAAVTSFKTPLIAVLPCDFSMSGPPAKMYKKQGKKSIKNGDQ